jgi:putative oxidoreductase
MRFSFSTALSLEQTMNFIYRIESLMQRLLSQDVTSLALRVALAVPFFRSGLTKWESFGVLSETPIFQFEEDFKIFGTDQGIPFPLFSAYASSIAEIVLPIMLVVGLFSRTAALGLLAMTFVIQLVMWDGWPIHLTWAAMALGVIALGSGRLSLDNYLFNRLRGNYLAA